MLVTILWRMENASVSTTVSNKFADVPSDAWYYQAVNWAASKGIVNGYQNGKFGADDSIKRQDLAVMLRNYANYKGKNTNITYDLSGFKDGNKVIDYAKTSMQWAVAKEVITGNVQTKTLNTEATATRAEVASMIYKYCVRVN